MRSREYRRHTDKVRKQRTVRVILRMSPTENPPTAKYIGRMAAVHHAGCSCQMCGNPRKYFGKETFQEHLSQQEFDAQVKELDLQVEELDLHIEPAPEPAFALAPSELPLQDIPEPLEAHQQRVLEPSHTPEPVIAEFTSEPAPEPPREPLP